MTTRYSTVTVGTAEQAITLSDTFRENGDRGVRQPLAQRDRPANVERANEERLAADRTRTPEQARILRDLERDTDDYDR